MESIAQHRHKANRLFNSLYDDGEAPHQRWLKIKWMHFHLLRALAMRGRQVRLLRGHIKRASKLDKKLNDIERGK